MSKFRPPSYRSSRDPASQRRCDVITPLSFIISIDFPIEWNRPFWKQQRWCAQQRWYSSNNLLHFLYNGPPGMVNDSFCFLFHHLRHFKGTFATMITKRLHKIGYWPHMVASSTDPLQAEQHGWWWSWVGPGVGHGFSDHGDRGGRSGDPDHSLRHVSRSGRGTPSHKNFHAISGKKQLDHSQIWNVWADIRLERWLSWIKPA